jgi:uncharacterized protein (DUF433 family)
MKHTAQSLIVVDPFICHGKPIIKDTRIMVWQILELLEAGESTRSIHAAFPTLPKGAVKAVLHYAAERAKGVSFRKYEWHEEHSQSHVFT